MYNQLLNEYLYYYYYRDEALKAIQGAGETRGEQIARINQEMREALRTVDARTQPEAAFTSGCSITYAGKTAICRTNPGRRNSTPANR
ncbi:maltose-6'-phosphate glucosidase [Klebsiella pneumoniae]|uniref:Maltose-6'-phosphate glucosidase n=1 Tax=Klebsiella pneumoniae TaxID=573 RepID=A0A2X3D4Q2_KLEPN|nr:maltose-6'-phosphate glucosidase [Klebsiella pneumoniae]